MPFPLSLSPEGSNNRWTNLKIQEIGWILIHFGRFPHKPWIIWPLNDWFSSKDTAVKKGALVSHRQKSRQKNIATNRFFLLVLATKLIFRGINPSPWFDYHLPSQLSRPGHRKRRRWSGTLSLQCLHPGRDIFSVEGHGMKGLLPPMAMKTALVELTFGQESWYTYEILKVFMEILTVTRWKIIIVNIKGGHLYYTI